MMKEFRIYSTVTGEFDFVSIVDLLTSDNSRISRKMVEDDLTVEQFTGLKDCEGANIYEGDIIDCVLIDKNGTKSKYRGKVFYQEYEFCIELEDNFWSVASFYCCEKCKIIGNIHKNPELLEEKQ